MANPTSTGRIGQGQPAATMAQVPSKPKRPYHRKPGAGAPGNQPFVPTDEQRDIVAGLRSVGTKDVIIAKVLNLSKAALYKHFGPELKQGKQIILAKIGVGVIQRALAGSKEDSRFYLKCHGGWHEANRVGFLDEDGNPAPVPEGGGQVHIYLPSNGRDG